MSENPFSPPETALDAPHASGADDGWFPVGLSKLVIMTIGTGGVYAMFWMERQYRYQKRAHGEDTWPIARGIFFSWFYCFELFRRAQLATDARGWIPNNLGAIYCALVLVPNLITRATMSFEPGPAAAAVDLLTTAMSCATAYPLVTVQKSLNGVIRGGDPNTRLTGWNLLALLIFGGILVSSFVGSLFELPIE